jgi:hypothetical protein
MHKRLAAALLACAVFAATPVLAQTNATPPSQAADDPDRDPSDAQPDFFVSTIPTTLRLPKHKMAFRLTHRFARPLGQGDAGALFENFFGLDNGAQMGFGLSYGLIGGTQLTFYRTSDRTIQFSGQREILNQKSAPVGAAVVLSAEGTNNFRDSYSPGVQVVLSRELADRGALYVAPAWVNNSSPQPSELVDDNDTVMVGLGARLRLRKNTYVTFEGSPRVAGFAPGVTLVSIGLEQRAGGHLFQLTFSNGLGTTLAQVARGGTASDDWYIGFNLTRKFF